MRSSARAWALAAPLATVVVLDPGGLAPYGPLKWAVLTASVSIAAGVVLARRRVRWRRRTLAPWGVFLVVVAVAAALGEDALYAWVGTPERHFGALTWALCGLAFVAGQQAVAREAGLVLRVAVATLGVTAAWSVAEAAGWEPIDLVGAGDRPVGTLGSSAFLGAAAALLLPIAAGLAAERAGRRRWLPAAVAAAGLLALLLSSARAAWVGTAVAVLVLLVVRRPRWHPTANRLAWWGAAVAGVLVVVVLAGAAGRLRDGLRDEDGGLRGRADEWRVATRVVADRPLLGVGPEGYRLAFGSAVDDDYEQDHGRAVLPDRAHSAVLDVAASTGLLGLAAYVAVLGAAGRGVVVALRRGRPLLAGTATGLLAYVTQSLFLFPLAELEPVAWLLAGVLLAALPDPGATRRRRLPGWVTPLLFAIAAVAVAGGVLDVAADRRARGILDGEVSTATAAADLRPDQLRYWLVAARALEATDPEAALDAVAHAVDRSPGDPVARGEEARLLLDRARRSARPSDVDRALAALESLAVDDPRNAEVLLRLGLARALDGDDAGARRSWRRAEALAPASPAASTNLALSYLEAGRMEEAREAAERALQRDPADPGAAEVLRRLASIVDEDGT